MYIEQIFCLYLPSVFSLAFLCQKKTASEVEVEMTKLKSIIIV